jgi:hypothetical protein
MSGDQVAALDVLASRDDDLTAALDWCEAAGEPTGRVDDGRARLVLVPPRLVAISSPAARIRAGGAHRR